MRTVRRLSYKAIHLIEEALGIPVGTPDLPFTNSPGTGSSWSNTHLHKMMVEDRAGAHKYHSG
ncbi:hypothetical protein B9Z19DRAFT_1095600 [Tuber borchii]|uniref:Uncharacterized protein n=1 Tax=Tuber borchii TaxID=42251 RepID=A0A2T6ZCM5_TUBBO|nr:hypothetical protein B9Z19DRAFT_1095600 [Tuber borchii]